MAAADADSLTGRCAPDASLNSPLSRPPHKTDNVQRGPEWGLAYAAESPSVRVKRRRRCTAWAQSGGPSLPVMALREAGLKQLASKAEVVAEEWQPVHIKKIVAEAMDSTTLVQWLHKHGEGGVARQVDAMQHLDAFDEEFEVNVSGRRAFARSRLPQHIFKEAEQAGVLELLPRRFRPAFSSPLKAVPDRKDPTLGRMILPCCRLNDATRDPDLCPIPTLPDLIRGVLGQPFVATADLRSWFYSFPVGHEVSAKYFAARDGEGRYYAHRRGPMGWKHMPSIACTTALAMLKASAGRLPAYAWIDDLCVAGPAEEVEVAMGCLRATAAELGAELRDVTAPTTRAIVVGVDLDLQRKAWRLDPKWIDKFGCFWETVSALEQLEARLVWRLAGYVAWGCYALQLPLLIASGPTRIAMGTLESDAGSPLSVHEYVTPFRSAVAAICANRWRTFAAAPTSCVVTDASTEGIGAVVGRREYGRLRTESTHINASEVDAVLYGLQRLRADPGTSVSVVVDNRVAYYAMRRWRSRGRGHLHDALVRLYEYCQRHQLALFPRWISTQGMAENGADAASRGVRCRDPNAELCLEASEALKCVSVTPLSRTTPVVAHTLV